MAFIKNVFHDKDCFIQREKYNQKIKIKKKEDVVLRAKCFLQSTVYMLACCARGPGRGSA